MSNSTMKPEKKPMGDKYPSIKVDGKGNVSKTAGRPTERRGTSDGAMIRNGKKC